MEDSMSNDIITGGFTDTILIPPGATEVIINAMILEEMKLVICSKMAISPIENETENLVSSKRGIFSYAEFKKIARKLRENDYKILVISE